SVSGKDAEWQARQIVEILIASQHRADSLKSKPSEPSFVLKKVALAFTKATNAGANKGIAIGQAVANGVNVARELGNLPGNVCTPTYLANEAKKLARGQTRLSVKILEE